MVRDWKKKKVAVYLRRSKGEKGNTQAQLDRIAPQLAKLEKDGKIAKVDRRIVGRPMDGRKFSPDRDLVLKGDIFNEGNGQSAFGSSRERQVFGELLKRVRDGEYEAVIATSLDRYSRDPLDFARARVGNTDALDMWREDGIQFWGLDDNRGYGTLEPFNESIITTQLMWGGEGKRQEARKAVRALDDKLARGFVQGKLKAELLGSGSKGAGMDYRRVWDLMQAYGVKETASGPKLQGRNAIAKEFGKDGSWASRLYRVFTDWDQLGVIDDWFRAVDALNQFIENQPGTYLGPKFKSEPVSRVLRASNGFVNYPGGVNPSARFPVSKDEFVTFPNPADFDLDTLASVEDPREVPTWEVVSVPLTAKMRGELLTAQTMARAAERARTKAKQKGR